ncbi:MAG: hypothetical protein NWE92_12490 [Candidatus Bathyarchaeota archaeon]|nr:hypothetical protein [Candidatus Bathyarchaeota archaeon]
MQISDASPSFLTKKASIEEQKEIVEKLKGDWKLLWSERFKDKVRAEDVSIDAFPTLMVEQGTIIHATRDFKTLNFKEILDQYKVENPERFIQPDPHTGGWNKFVKANITNQKNTKKHQTQQIQPKSNKPKKQQPTKARGWLHTA